MKSLSHYITFAVKRKASLALFARAYRVYRYGEYLSINRERERERERDGGVQVA